MAAGAKSAKWSEHADALRHTAGFERRSRGRLADLRSPKLVAPARLTLSVGVAARTPEEGGDAWLDRAERALRAAKHAGRNRIGIAAADGSCVTGDDRRRIEVRADLRGR